LELTGQSNLVEPVTLKNQGKAPTIKRIHDTKQRLLDVAFDLIWDSSYGSVSVDDICKGAGVKKGSFYHFFPTKADLAIAACRARWEAVKPVYDRMFAAKIPPLDRIRAWCRHVNSVQKEKAKKFDHVCGCPYASMGAELATQDDRIRASSEELIYSGRKYLRKAIADAIQAGVVTVSAAGVAAQRAYSMCLGMIFEAKVRNSLNALRNLEPTIMELLGAKGGTTKSVRPLRRSKTNPQAR
jgi:TetR/AcrR family transcriptional repressor of nem operon